MNFLELFSKCIDSSNLEPVDPVIAQIEKTYPTIELEGVNKFLARINEIINISNSLEKNPVYVPEGSGILVGKDRELYTDLIFSCIGVFIKGEETNGLIHMTRRQEMAFGGAYGNKAPADVIADSLENIKDPSILIIEPDFFENQKEVEESLAHLEKTLREKSLRVKRVKLKITGLGLYYSPKTPKNILAFGKRSTQGKATRVSPLDKIVFEKIPI